MRGFALFLVAVMALSGCGDDTANDRPADTPPVQQQPAVEVPMFTYRIIHQYPHDTSAFTQGLLYHEGRLLESTGREGFSSLREVELESGRVLRRFELAPSYFAEGLALHDGRLYQLTWRNFTGFVYDLSSFRQIDTFGYYGEGWGLVSDGRRMYMSDGSSTLRILNPADMTVAETLEVRIPGGPPVANLNELEWVEGEIWANVWGTHRIVRIDPSNGTVKGIIDLAGILPESARSGTEDVLNGIAYDPATKRIFVTGKLWPLLFEIEVVPRAV